MLSRLALLLSLWTTLATLTSANPIQRRQFETYPAPNVVPAPQQSWIDTYNIALVAGRIPTLPPAVGAAGVVNYVGIQPNCSWTISKCYADDIHATTSGIVALGFDDGPSPASTALYTFLRSQNVRATHFIIGSNVVYYPDVFDRAIGSGAHIGSHTWSHRSMTTLTDLEVLGELGWTSQIIFDRTGRLPAFWRPPYGDVDERVRAIAREVFGLRTVIWNADTNDWGTPDPVALAARLNGLYYAPKTPAGLMVLEHEMNSRSVSAFVETYPTLQNQGWRALSIPDSVGLPWYQNSATGNSTIAPGYTLGSGPARNRSLTTTTSSSVRSTISTLTPSPTQLIITGSPPSTTALPSFIPVALPAVRSLGKRLSISVEIPAAVLGIVGGMILWV